jgi:hemolysin type calcium-binding protein
MAIQQKSSPLRLRLGTAIAAAAAAACALPAGASAATVEVNSNEVLHRGSGSEINIVNVREVAGALIVTDSAGLSHPATRDPGRRCTSVDRQTMRCPARRFEAQMGDGDDVAGPMDTQLPVEINGEGGADVFRAFNPSFLTNVEFVGGSDFDSVSYAGSGGASGGRGVRVNNDGQPNDGRPGLDTDNIGRDVEGIVGSSLNDDITINGAPNIFANFDSRMTVRGGLGDDVLRAGTGRRVVFEMGKTPDGADKILSGSVAISIINYEDRTRPVTATLASGGADDGEAGERDEILGDHKEVYGGSAGDVLRAPVGSTIRRIIDGKGGGDKIEGTEGADTLIGGPGGDQLAGFGGDDHLLARDGQSDTVDCGLQTDTVEVDSIDNFGNCENGTIGVLRLAPKALRARAGETAKLKLSWRHPQGWKQLRSVTLRVYRGKAMVGAVAIATGSRRIESRGAVKLVRRGTRLARKGKTVSARLALRLDRKLAGRRLRLDVEAKDVAGARQLERGAGSIRVAR